MNVKVKKWGNSLAMRIPKSLALEANIEDGSVLDLSLKNGEIVIKPISKLKYSLEQLLDEITKDNIPGEMDTGSPVGKEVW